MLSELTIENIAVINKVTINFTRGFNCLTGETGAGKSIIIDAINCITGEKTSRELIRSDEKFAKVTAVFCDISPGILKLLDDYDISPEDGDLIISRKITRDGKNTCRVNGSPIPVSVLKVIGDELVNIHGQMDSKNLLDPERHFSYIDLFGNTESLLNEYRADYGRLSDIRAEIKNLTVDESAKLKEIDMLDYQIEELESANLHIGELSELTERRKISRNAKKIAEILGNAFSYLSGAYETDGASVLIENAANELEDITDFIGDFSDYPEKLRDIVGCISDIADEIQSRLESISYSDGELNEIEERIDTINRLMRKYGSSEEEMIEYLNKSKKRREEIDLSEDRLAELNLLFDDAAEKAKKSAKALSKRRREAALQFAGKVTEELKFLNMPDVVFTVSDKIVPLNINGVDNMSFLFSANKGEDVKPLSKIASGGELSRVMLAVKNVLSECDSIDTLIFDEIDTGVSGSAAEKIAMKLFEVSLKHQIICVTHLTQLACFADSHFFISKETEEDKTFTTVKILSFDERCKELARIGTGTNIGKLQIDNAKEMIEFADKYKKNITGGE